MGVRRGRLERIGDELVEIRKRLPNPIGLEGIGEALVEIRDRMPQ